ncbi:MAG TPA: hypothetical protein VE777_08400 [Gaiellales bacterium]|jgi:energy-coupling factor transporter ATP-binding protein EcfA2|nr:hypothetical protein [Gaiellales bacterium]
MSIEAVQAAVNCLPWHSAVAEMGLAHVPLAEIAQDDLERDLARRAAAGERLLLLGPRGSGKSSAVAAALGPLADLPENLVVIHIPILVATASILTEPLEFCQYLLGQVEQWAAPTGMLSDRDLRLLQAAAADDVVVTRGGQGLHLGVGVPLNAVRPEVGADLRSRVTQIRSSLNGPTLAASFDAMLRAFGGLDMSPFFCFDDADQWTALDGRPDSLVAEPFFRRVIGWLARNAMVGFLVSVRDDYRALPGYHEAVDLMTELHIPPLHDPPAALDRIITRRFELEELSSTSADVFAADAIMLLAEAYEDARDLRRTLKLASFAIHSAADRGADLVGSADITAARRVLAAGG